jgi:hypothetical protein
MTLEDWLATAAAGHVLIKAALRDAIFGLAVWAAK